MGDELKVRESRLRRVAARRGLVLQKARRRDPGALDYGMYWLADSRGTKVCASQNLEDIGAFLSGYDAKAAPGA